VRSRNPIVTIAAACAFLTACSGGDSPEAASAATTTSSTSSSSASPTPASSSASPSSQVPAPLGQDAFVRQMESSGIVPRYGSADGVVQLGQAICQRYGAGGARADVMTVLTQGGMTEADAGETNAAAIVAFCPAFASQITG
jgi:hypothetical protein